MKIEMHAHTWPVSPCSRISPEDLVHRYVAAGYDAVVLTNHYSEYSMPELGDTLAEKKRNYLADYKAAVSAAAGAGIRILLGAEVAIQGPYSRAEFLLYGITEAFIVDSPNLIELSQKELYSLCEKSGVVMVQAHPYRTEFGMVPQDPAYMDGLEVNCHPAHLREEEKVTAFVRKHDLLVTAGSDFHGDRIVAGILTDTDVNTTAELAAVLRAKQYRYFFDDTVRALPI